MRFILARHPQDCAWIRIVHCHISDAALPEFQRIVTFLDQCYPKIKIDLVCAHGIFEPDLVNRLSVELKIPHVRHGIWWP